MTTPTTITQPNISRQLQHLYQRAGFGLSPQEWQARKGWTREAALRELFGYSDNAVALELPPPPFGGERLWMIEKEKRVALRKEERQRVLQYNADWVLRMASSRSAPLLERMSLFWHGHFACESRIGRLVVQYLNSIRQHALGNFRDLAVAIAKAPAMIRYLNNQQNKKNQPNENFARELMELFTLGRGHYSEQDVKEAARAFTGWASNKQGEYIFRAKQHDFGYKTFLGKSGNFNGEDIIDAILEKPEAALFITRKIYRYFVNEQVDEKRVARLADSFYQSNYDIKALMWSIFSSDWFYAPENCGSRIKSPVELTAGLMKQLGIQEIGTHSLVGLQIALGQMLFRPPNVAGWPGGKSWIDNSTLMMRLQIPGALYKASGVDFRFKDEPEREAPKQLRRLKVTINWQPLYAMVAGKSEAETFEALAAYLLAAPLSVDRETVMKYVSRKNKEELVQTLCIRLMSLPEYQLC